MILICYDGSPDSRAAIAHAGELLGGQPASVLTVWQPYVSVLVHIPAGFGLAPAIADADEFDRAASETAQERAEEGAKLARDAGLDAQPLIRDQVTSTAEAILNAADAVSASAIVLGSRGLTGIRSLLLGSVSHAVLQRADRAVIVVPSPEVASARGRERRERAGSGTS